MKSAQMAIVLVLALALSSGCSAISSQLRSQAVLDPPLRSLVPASGPPSDRLVLLGGYVLETVNERAESRVTVLQAPLGIGDEPGVPEQSQGRFVLRQAGFLDPALYAKDRKLTAVGRVIGTITTQVGDQEQTIALIDALEIHLWPVAVAGPYDSCTWCDDPFYDRYYYRPLWYRQHYYYKYRYHHPYRPYYRPYRYYRK